MWWLLQKVILFVLGVAIAEYYILRSRFLDRQDWICHEIIIRYYRTHAEEGRELIDWMFMEEHYRTGFERWFRFWDWSENAVIRAGFRCFLSMYYKEFLPIK